MSCCRAALLWSILVVGLSASRTFAEDNWPQWRGPHANGTAASKNLPTTWSATENIVWQAELPAWSGGTPVIWGDRIFVTSPSKPAAAAAAPSPTESAALQIPSGLASTAGVFAQQQDQPGRGPGGDRGPGGRGPRGDRGPGGRGPGGPGGRFGRGGGRDPGGQSLLLICLSRKDGNQLWQQELDNGNELRNKGNSTSPSPVTDGKHVWIVTGNGVVVAFDMAGTQVWKRSLQQDYGKFGLNWGYASSPLLVDGKLIVQVLQGMKTDDPSYIVALDSLTGKEIWREKRPTDAESESPDAYTTPALIQVGGKQQFVISGGDYVTGHDVASGREIWRAGGLNPSRRRDFRVVASPVIVGDMIFASARKAPILAMRAGGTGDVTESQHVWTYTKSGAPDVPTPVSDGKYLFLVDDQGLATCLDAKSGDTVWGPQRSGAGNVSASPLLADGKLYIVNENGATTVLAAGPEFKVLATNELDGGYTLSSPVTAGNQLFIRTGTRLYCIGAAAAGKDL